jgi:trans-aconitate methyltransferase
MLTPNAGALRTATFREIMSAFPPKEADVLFDLGAGPCIFAKIAKKAGYDVVAVDARDERIPDDLNEVRFVHCDVRTCDISSGDVICILGLFYHLDLETQIDLLKRVPNHALAIIDTQIHVPDEIPENASSRFQEASEQGYEGAFFTEGNNPMASVGNERSFIHTPDSMERLLTNTGFSQTARPYPDYVSKYGARGWFLAAKSQFPTPLPSAGLTTLLRERQS